MGIWVQPWVGNLPSLLLKGYTFYYTVIIIYVPTYLKTMKWWSHEAPNFKCECMITLLSFWLAKPSQISSVVKGNLHLHQMNYDKDFYHHKAKEITTPFLLILSKTWWTHAPPKGYELADFVKLFGRESSSECFFHLYTIYNFHSEKLFPPKFYQSNSASWTWKINRPSKPLTISTPSLPQEA